MAYAKGNGSLNDVSNAIDNTLGAIDNSRTESADNLNNNNKNNTST